MLNLRNLDNALETFNESFASWLYVMNMNALTIDWPQVRLYPYETAVLNHKRWSSRPQQRRLLCWPREGQVRYTVILCVALDQHFGVAVRGGCAGSP